MSYQPPWQPIRPEGNHRTHVKGPTNTFIPWTPKNIVVQIQLYRWCHSVDFQQQTIIADLRPFLFAFFPSVTKRDMGMNIVQATRYNPRKLKAPTMQDPRAYSTYVFQNVNDLKYGLEWMICTWIHKAKDTEDAKDILNFLDEMALCDERDVNRLYLEPLGQWWNSFGERSQSWDWNKIWDKYGYTYEETISGPATRPTLRML